MRRKTGSDDAWEAFLESKGLDFGDLLKSKPYLFVIVHAESSYKAPLTVGDKLRVDLSIEDVGDSSFSILYSLYKEDGVLAGTAKTVHVSIDKTTREKITIPDEMRVLI